MASIAITPSSYGPSTDWSSGVGYIYTSTPNHVHEAKFAETAVPSGNMVMAVKFNIEAKTTGSGTLKITVRRGTTADDRIYATPRETSINLTAAETEYSITMSNQPFPDLIGSDSSWSSDGTDLDSYSFGVEAVSVGSGEIQVYSMGLEIIYRPTVTLDELLTDEETASNLSMWQWVEIEGIRWIPSTNHLPNDCGSYYYGIDRRPVAGSLLINEEFRGSKISHARGAEETETARFVVIDQNQVAHEHDANGGDAPVTVYPQGFWSWLLAYGDRTNATRMTDSTGTSLNTVKGLDPKDWNASTYGRKFTVGSTTGFPAGANTDDSYLYVNNETIWYNSSDADSFGDDSDTNDLQRGQFGSLNQVHEYTIQSGIYPEVTDHPSTWAGRWVKIWFNAIDPATGYPFPFSVARARMYMWGDHNQAIGPGSAKYTIRLSAAKNLLKVKVPNVEAANVRRINFGQTRMMSVLYYNVANQPQQVPVDLSQLTYPDVATLCSDIQTNLNTALGSPLSLAFRCALSSGTNRVSFLTYYATSPVYIALQNDLSACLGFGADEETSTPEPYFAATSITNDWYTWVAEDAPCQSFVAANASKVHVASDSTDDWPDTLAGLGTWSYSQKERLALFVGEDEESSVFGFQSTAIGSDTYGDYLAVYPKTPPAMASLYKRRNRMFSRVGDDPIKCRPMLVVDTLELHNFWLRILTSTGFGTNGSNDTYPRGFGASIDARLIDTTAWTNASTGLPSASLYRTYFMLEQETLEKYLNEELEWPSALYLLQNTDGNLSLEFRSTPSSSDNLPDVKDEHIRRGQPIEVSHGASANLVNDITVEIDFNPLTGKYGSKLIAKEANSQRRYGVKSKKSKHRGLRSLATGVGKPTSTSPFSLFVALCRQIFDRWAWEAPTINIKGTNRFFAIRVGDSVTATIGKIGDILSRGASGRGVTSRAMEVVKNNPNLRTGNCDVEIVSDQLNRKYGGYAPSAEVVSWSAGTKTVIVQANSFTDSTGSSADASYFSKGDKIYVIEYNASAPSIWQAEIEAVNGNEIQFTSSPGVGDRTPSQYDRIVFDEWDDQTATQQAQGWAHVSDGGTVSADGTTGFNYGI
jgi:hypothetical protein